MLLFFSSVSMAVIDCKDGSDGLIKRTSCSCCISLRCASCYFLEVSPVSLIMLAILALSFFVWQAHTHPHLHIMLSHSSSLSQEGLAVSTSFDQSFRVVIVTKLNRVWQSVCTTTGTPTRWWLKAQDPRSGKYAICTLTLSYWTFENIFLSNYVSLVFGYGKHMEATCQCPSLPSSFLLGWNKEKERQTERERDTHPSFANVLFHTQSRSMLLSAVHILIKDIIIFFIIHWLNKQWRENISKEKKKAKWPIYMQNFMWYLYPWWLLMDGDWWVGCCHGLWHASEKYDGSRGIVCCSIETDFCWNLRKNFVNDSKFLCFVRRHESVLCGHFVCYRQKNSSARTSETREATNWMNTRKLRISERDQISRTLCENMFRS